MAPSPEAEVVDLSPLSYSDELLESLEGALRSYEEIRSRQDIDKLEDDVTFLAAKL